MEIAAAIFEEVYVDMDRGEIAALKPREVFLPLFQALWQARVVSGDPDRIRVDQTRLFEPLLAEIAARRAFEVAA